MTSAEHSFGDRFIRIAYISAAYGIKGEVKALPLSDFPERFGLLDKAFLFRDGSRREGTVDKAKMVNKSVILKFKGVDSRASAEALKGTYVEVDEKGLFPLPENTWYEFQIIGLAVNDIYGIDLGKVVSVIQTGANAVLVVKQVEKEFLIPMIKTVVKDINIKQGIIIVDLPKGLIDE